MAECFHCGISGNKALLYEGIYKTGIVNVCRKCYFKLGIPLIEHKNINWDEVDKRVPVKDRLANLSKVNIKKKASKFSPSPEDVQLRQLVEKNLKKEMKISKETPEDLRDNFNWVIMRKRRFICITKANLASKIGESEAMVCSIEKGNLPVDYKNIITKIENVLAVDLFKKKEKPENKKIKYNFLQKDKEENNCENGNKNEEEEKKSRFNLKSVFNKFFKKDLSSENLEEKEEKISAKDLNLETVNNLVGKPIEDEKLNIKNQLLEIKRKRREAGIREMENIKNKQVISEEKKVPYELYKDENYHRELKADVLMSEKSKTQVFRDENPIIDSQYKKSELVPETKKKIPEFENVMREAMSENHDVNSNERKSSKTSEEEKLTIEDIRKISWGG